MRFSAFIQITPFFSQQSFQYERKTRDELSHLCVEFTKP